MFVNILFCRITRIAFVVDLLNVFTCSMNHHTTDLEHLMSTVVKKTILHHDVRCNTYAACVM